MRHFKFAAFVLVFMSMVHSCSRKADISRSTQEASHSEESKSSSDSNQFTSSNGDQIALPQFVAGAFLTVSAQRSGDTADISASIYRDDKRISEYLVAVGASLTWQLKLNGVPQASNNLSLGLADAPAADVMWRIDLSSAGDDPEIEVSVVVSEPSLGANGVTVKESSMSTKDREDYLKKSAAGESTKKVLMFVHGDLFDGDMGRNAAHSACSNQFASHKADRGFTQTNARALLGTGSHRQLYEELKQLGIPEKVQIYNTGYVQKLVASSLADAFNLDQGDANALMKIDIRYLMDGSVPSEPNVWTSKQMDEGTFNCGGWMTKSGKGGIDYYQYSIVTGPSISCSGSQQASIYCIAW